MQVNTFRLLPAQSSKLQTFSTSRGFSVFESLIALMISSVLLTAIVTTFAGLSQISSDHKQRTLAQMQAQTVLDMMVPEFRMIGNGVPFHQTNFLIAQAGMTDNTVTQPIVVNGTWSTQIQFRLNETGNTYVTTAAYTPSASSTITLSSVDGINVGDTVYLTNATVADDDGLAGTVSAKNAAAKTITLTAGYQYSASAAVFGIGSLLEVVPIITYASAGSYAGITRQVNTGTAQTLATNSQFSLKFLNTAGTAMTLPLVASSADPFPASAIQNCHSIEITVQVRSNRKLSTGQYYVASAQQVVGLRNLNFKY